MSFYRAQKMTFSVQCNGTHEIRPSSCRKSSRSSLKITFLPIKNVTEKTLCKFIKPLEYLCFKLTVEAGLPLQIIAKYPVYNLSIHQYLQRCFFEQFFQHSKWTFSSIYKALPYSDALEDVSSFYEGLLLLVKETLRTPVDKS